MKSAGSTSKSHYALLGVGQGATNDEIKAAWRAIARRTHPDKTPDPAKWEEYKDASIAYHVLGNPQSRHRYNQELDLLAKCPRCDGTGMIYKQKGFTNRIPVVCPECNHA